MITRKKLLLAGLCACMVMAVHAADTAKPVATVNGVKLGSELMDVLISNALAQGATDSADLRNQLRNELVTREVLAQEARRQHGPGANIHPHPERTEYRSRRTSRPRRARRTTQQFQRVGSSLARRLLRETPF